MSVEIAFSVPLFIEKLSIDNSKIKKFAYDLRNRFEGVKRSNSGGWHSEDLDIYSSELSEITTSITEQGNVFFKDLGYDTQYDLCIQSLWININSFGDNNVVHSHLPSFFSGVYYIDCDEKAGNIVFNNPNQSHLTPNIIKHQTTATAPVLEIIPEVSKLIIFPSWLWHYVEPSKSNNDRISLSFNLNVRYGQGGLIYK